MAREHGMSMRIQKTESMYRLYAHVQSQPCNTMVIIVIGILVHFRTVLSVLAHWLCTAETEATKTCLTGSSHAFTTPLLNGGSEIPGN